MNKDQIDLVENKLEALHKDARKDFMRIGKGIVRSAFRPIQPSDFENVYLPISKEQGKDIRQIIIENNCKQIVEFGTSFGISTLYLGDGAKEVDGKVITTELLESKAQIAMNNIEEAELSDYVEFRIGDAMETLRDFTRPIDFLFLDGWKDLYLPLFQLLEPHFHTGTIIYADNMDMSGTKYYGDYIRNKRSSFSSESMHDGKGLLTKVL